jgi:uncharacterized membrane protein YheB (UPF0754 family)
MNIYIFAPISGAVIGYFTNWLAIKMLFKPYNEVFIFGLKLPFTPGLIGKERYLLSKKIGSTINEHLITPDMIKKSLLDNISSEATLQMLDTKISSFKDKDLTIQEAMVLLINQFNKDYNNDDFNIFITSLETYVSQNITSDEFNNAINLLLSTFIDYLFDVKTSSFNSSSINEFVSKAIAEFTSKEEYKEVSQKTIENFLAYLKDNKTQLNNYVQKDVLSSFVCDMLPTIIEFIITNLNNNETLNMHLKKITTNILDSNVNKMVAMFINKDTMYDNIKSEAISYLQNEENIEIIKDMIIQYICTGLDYEVGQIIDKLPLLSVSHATQNIFSKELLCTLIESLSKNLCENDYTIGDIVSMVDTDYKQHILNAFNVNIKNFINKNNKNISCKIIYILKSTVLSAKINYFIEKIDFKKEYLIKKYFLILDFIFEYIIKQINVSKIIEEQINCLDIREVETLIQSVVSRELKSITIVGGVLGFIVGSIPLIMSLIAR